MILLCSDEKVKFASAVRSGSLPHACIIEGASENAKSEFVRYVLPYILCESNSACGHCPSCAKLAGGSHPDLRYVGGDGKPANMEAVRSLIADSRMVPVENGRKVYVLMSGEKLRKEAQNALLKVLEEPPKAVVILILTEKREALLPTIRSRCRMITLTDEPEDKKDKATKDAASKAYSILQKLFSGSSTFDFYVSMCDKTTRDKLALLLKELQKGLLEMIKSKDNGGTGEYAELSSQLGRDRMGLMLDAVADAERANEGNANMASLQMSLAVRLWELRK